MTPTRRKALRELYRRDFARFARDQLKITTKTPGPLVPFKLNAAQRTIHAVVERQRAEKGWVRLCLLKRRQMGGSTYAQGRLFHSTVMTKNFSSLLIAQDKDTTSTVFRMSLRFLEEMATELRPMIQYQSKTGLMLGNPNRKDRSANPGLRSLMDFQTAGNLNAGTGSTRHALQLSEAAKYSDTDLQLLVASLMPSIHLVEGTMIFIESTAFIYGDWFREMCEAARRGETEYKFVFVPWWVSDEDRVPLEPGEKLQLTAEEKAIVKLAERGQPSDNVPPMQITPEQIKWRRLKLAAPESDMFPQEYPATYEEAWVRLDIEFFERDKLQELFKQVKTPLRLVEIMPDGSVKTLNKGHATPDKNYIAIWKEPEPGHTYDIGVDVALGEEHSDWSVAEVFDRYTHEQVAEYHKHIDVYDLGDEVVALAKFYTAGSGNMAQLVPEMNSYGLVTFQRISQLGYPYVYRWRHRDYEVPTMAKYAGWKTQTDSKKMLMGQYRHMVSKLKLIIHSQVLWHEMRNFVRLPDEGCRAGMGHDDCVMAAAIAIIGGTDETQGASNRPPPAKNSLDEIVQRALENAPHLRQKEEVGQQARKVLGEYGQEVKGWQ